MNTAGPEDEATDYRINATLNKLRAASDRADALAEELKSLKHGMSPAIYDEVRRDPNFLAFLFQPLILRPIRFLYYLVVDIRRLGRRGLSRAPSTLDAVSSKRAAPRDIAAVPQAPRLLLDVTGARTRRVGGGIKRVCDRFASLLGQTGRATPCGLRDGKLFKADQNEITEEELSFRPDDTYLMFDSFWDPLDEYVAITKRAKAAGATTALCIYDAFPISRPKLVADEFNALFIRSCQSLLPYVDGIVSISQASADEVQGSLRRVGFERPVTWFELGCDAFDVRNHWSPNPVPAFLSIGTLEPKKGYDVALDAFEILWAEGVQATYTIVGKEGWLCEALVARILHHPDFGKRLFWRSNLSDGDLSELVGTSYCLIQASLAEGFGLPVAEAAASGLPVIASDLPVFREICAQDAVFFPVCDSVALATAIRGAIEQRPPAPKLNVQSWEEAAASLIGVLDGLRSREVGVQT